MFSFVATKIFDKSIEWNGKVNGILTASIQDNIKREMLNQPQASRPDKVQSGAATEELNLYSLQAVASM